MEYRFHAVVMRKRDINETDRLYTFFTRERGRVSAIARGVRKSGARLAGQLENFSVVAVSIMRNRGLGNINSAFIEKSMSTIRSSYDVLKNVFEASAIVERSQEDDEPEDRVFMLLEQFLGAQNRLAKTDDVLRSRLVRAAFLFRYVEVLGYVAELSVCDRCARKPDSTDIFVNISTGSLVCGECISRAYRPRRVSKDLIKLLRIIRGNSLESLYKLTVPDKLVVELETFEREYRAWHIG